MAMALLLSGSIHGDDKKDPKVKGVLPPNWGKLKLSDEQKQKVYKVQADYKDKIGALEKQMEDLKGKQNADMVNVLTEDQKKMLRDILTGKLPADKDTPKDKDKDKEKDK